MTRNAYEEYYLNQAGSGLPVFVGSRHTKGYGIGNVLSGLIRLAVPVLKRTGKAVVREGLRTGIDVLSDVASGKNIKQSVQNRVKQTGSRLVKKAVRTIHDNDRVRSRSPSPPPPPPPGRNRYGIKRRLNTPRSQSSKKRRQNRDIFG